MLNLNKDTLNTVYSYFTSYTGVAPYILRLVDNLDGFAKQDFELSISAFGERVSYSITPVIKEGDYTYEIVDANGKQLEKGFAQIK